MIGKASMSFWVEIELDSIEGGIVNEEAQTRGWAGARGKIQGARALAASPVRMNRRRPESGSSEQ